MINPRINPVARKNPLSFWHGYGRFREGTWYDDAVKEKNYSENDRDHCLAGWCFGLTEKKRWKPWWHSKYIWTAVAGLLFAVFTIFYPELCNKVAENKTVSSILFALLSSWIMGLRFSTHTSLYEGGVPSNYPSDSGGLSF
jgi:hypothetical protein